MLAKVCRNISNKEILTCLCSSHAYEIAIRILLPLDPAIVLTGEILSVKRLSVQHCHDEIELADRFLKNWPADGLVGRGQFITLSTLVPFLQDHSTHGLFTAASQLLRFTVTALPVTKIFLEDIRALAWNLEQGIPPSARLSFEGLEHNDNVRDPPTSFVLPQPSDLQAVMADDDDDLSETGHELSKMISKWADLTVDA